MKDQESWMPWPHEAKEQGTSISSSAFGSVKIYGKEKDHNIYCTFPRHKPLKKEGFNIASGRRTMGPTIPKQTDNLVHRKVWLCMSQAADECTCFVDIAGKFGPSETISQNNHPAKITWRLPNCHKKYHHKSAEDGHLLTKTHGESKDDAFAMCHSEKNAREGSQRWVYHWKTIGFSAKTTDHTSAHSCLKTFSPKRTLVWALISEQHPKSRKTIRQYIDFKLGIHEPPSWTVDFHRSYADVCASLKLWSSLL